MQRTEKLNIYFAGAIRGGREDAGLYGRMIAFLQKFGTVLTAHVGDEKLLAAEKDLTEQEIYARDMAWLQLAHLVIAEVSTPSLGVGYEIAAAESLGKEIFCLYRPRPGSRLSAMVAGCPRLQVMPYNDYPAAEKLLRQFLRNFFDKQEAVGIEAAFIADLV